jgi:hypothetical protein
MGEHKVSYTHGTKGMRGTKGVRFNVLPLSLNMSLEIHVSLINTFPGRHLKGDGGSRTLEMGE